jgi:hypothetical protein
MKIRIIVTEPSMKKLVLVAVLAVATLSGCVVAPVGHGHVRHRPVIVGPAVVAPPPVVVVRPDRRGDGRGYHRHDRGHDRGHWGRDRDDDRGDDRRWRRD